MLQGKMSPTTHPRGNQMGEQEVGRLWAIGEAPAPSTGRAGWGRDQHPGTQGAKCQEGPQDPQHPLTAVLYKASVKGKCHASLSDYLKKPQPWTCWPVGKALPQSGALPSSNTCLPVPNQPPGSRASVTWP